MKFVYPAIFHLEDNNYWVEFPDLDGCFSQGDDLKEAIQNAQEALVLYLEDLTEFPVPTNIQNITSENKTDFVSYIMVDVVSTKSIKKTLTIPEWLNRKAIDSNINFSQTLQEALLQKLQ